jgi:hypothetical protein
MITVPVASGTKPNCEVILFSKLLEKIHFFLSFVRQISHIMLSIIVQIIHRPSYLLDSRYYHKKYQINLHNINKSMQQRN